METTRVSIVIPSYNGAAFIGETIQSVLNQTYHNFEVFVVDDISTDNTAEVVNQFADPRVKFIQLEEKGGANVARNMGVKLSSGELIAFLDHDDLFHPEKLKMHVEFMDEHPEIGMTYNPRYELHHSSSAIREIWWPPDHIQLSDLVLNFPISPSEMVMRREWALNEGRWNEDGLVNGDEITLTGRLFMSGCKFANVRRVLNYRRYFGGRIFRNLKNTCKAEIWAREVIFSDPRCPKEVAALRNEAFKNGFLAFAAVAFTQEETALAQEFLREAIKNKPSILEGSPSELIDFFAGVCVQDQTIDHCFLLRRILNQFPEDLAHLSEGYDWAAGRGYLLKGINAVMWGSEEEAHAHFSHAAELKAVFDKPLLGKYGTYLLDYDTEFGEECSQKILSKLIPYLLTVGSEADARWLKSYFAINKAFRNYRQGTYKNVPNNVLRAVLNQPNYLFNRGVLSITARSLLKLTK